MDREAQERQMTKADLIRTALGWERVDAAPRKPTHHATAPTQPQLSREPIGLPAAVDQLAKRLRQ